MNSPIAATTDGNRDHRDISSALAALKRSSSSAEELSSEYLADDSKTFKRQFEFDLEPFKLFCEVGTKIRLGGSGLVLCVTNRDQRLVRYALKIPRPSFYQSQTAVDDLAREFNRTKLEYINHAPLSHKNIAQFIAHKPVPIALKPGLEPPFPTLLFEWVEGAKPLIDYLAEARLSWPKVIELLIQLFEALAHLHSKDLVHWDVKSDNFLVTATGVPKLTDIGNARHIQSADSDLTAYSTIWNLPPKLFERARAATGDPQSSRRTPIPLDSNAWDTPWLDLWMLGRELNRAFAADEAVLKLDEINGFPQRTDYDEKRNKLLSTFRDEEDDARYALSFVRLVLQRLLLPKCPDDSRYYSNAADVASDLAKLQTEFGAAQVIPELQAIPQHVLRLPHSGNVPLTARVRRFLDCPLLRNSTLHLQLGSVCQVYPGATHRRSEHLFGVFYCVTQYVRALFADRTDPFWRISIEQEDIKALLLAAMLHDIGHLAFGHALEEMEGIFHGQMHEDYVLGLTEFPKALPTPELRQDRATLIQAIVAPWEIPQSKVDDFLQRVASILRPPAANAVITEQNARLLPDKAQELKAGILHSIIDSAIDADKLDYLMRDALHCGVQYPQGIDFDRFFQALTCVTTISKEALAYQRKDGWPFPCIGLSEKGILPAESIFIARYQMFSSVYWQHTVRAYTAMLQFCVQEFLGARASLTIERRAELIRVFRTQPDQGALKWLKEKLNDPSIIIDETRRKMLAEACEGLLGDRSKLYRQRFELRYKGGPLREGATELHARSVTAKLTAIWDLMNKGSNPNNPPDPYTCIEKMRTFRKDYSRRLSALLNQKVKFEDGEILIDIPPSNKDQIEDVFVVTDKGPIPIQELSPVADGVCDTFKYWARRARVFVSPSALAKVEKAAIGTEQLRRVCENVMEDITNEETFQQDLFSA